MKKNRKKQVLIFTDLDGTLLDHDSYDWQPASAALTLAKELDVPVIPCTSKTYAECRKLVKDLNLTGPFIYENGAGIALPLADFPPVEHPRVEIDGDYWLFSLGIAYNKVRKTLESLRSTFHYQFRGLGDMSLAQICESTGLDEEGAKLASQRRHGEALLWLDNAKSFDQFVKDIKRADLHLTRGGRFIHVMGDYNKGQAMLWLARLYHHQRKLPPFLIAAGDSGNDIPMLQLADAAVVVRPPHRTPLELAPAKSEQLVITTELPGPAGWNQAIITLLQAENIHG